LRGRKAPSQAGCSYSKRMGTQEGCHFGASSDEDTQLMVLAAGGDAAAFARLYKKYVPIITAYITSRNGRHRSVEDLTQEVFARLWQNRRQFRKDSIFKNYLYGIARNVLSDESKRLAKQVSIENEVLLKHSSVVPEGAWEPDERLCRGEIRQAAEQAISKLCPPQQQAIRIFYFDGPASVESMANRANCSVEAFRSRLRRAHGRLQKLLGYLPASEFEF
jgi:RNA polymerase sigma-70 factor (ECF subfamily)